jgi:hypothetical protein
MKRLGWIFCGLFVGPLMARGLFHLRNGDRVIAALYGVGFLVEELVLYAVGHAEFIALRIG